MRAVVNKALPLANLVASLKDKVVKGRAPNTDAPSRPSNPAQVRGTCSVCFRPIAVLGGTMAPHGYRRPQIGMQSAGCAGERFEPLEVSSAGLVWLRNELRAQLAVCEQAHAQRNAEPAFLLAPTHSGGPPEKIMRDDPQWWSSTFSRYVAKLVQRIALLRDEIALVEQKLSDWQPQALAPACSTSQGQTGDKS